MKQRQATNLTDKERRFAERWAADPQHNGTRAARVAGYKGRSPVLAATASRLLRRGKVQAYVAELRHEAIQKARAEREDAVMGVQECLQRLTAFSRARLGDYIDDNGNVDLDRIREAPAGLIRSFRGYQNTVESGETTITSLRTHLDLESSLAATVKLIEHHRGVTEPPGLGREQFLEALSTLPTPVLQEVLQAMRAAKAIDVTPQGQFGAPR